MPHPLHMFYGNLAQLGKKSNSKIRLRSVSVKNWCNVWSMEDVTVYGLCNGCDLPTEDAYSFGHLLLSLHFGTRMCSNVETNLSWTCLVPGLLSFEHSSVLLFCFVNRLHRFCMRIFSQRGTLLVLLQPTTRPGSYLDTICAIKANVVQDLWYFLPCQVFSKYSPFLH